jgi:hypothetical protein
LRLPAPDRRNVYIAFTNSLTTALREQLHQYAAAHLHTLGIQERSPGRHPDISPTGCPCPAATPTTSTRTPCAPWSWTSGNHFRRPPAQFGPHGRDRNPRADRGG